MPRDNKSSYTPAFQAVTDASQATGLYPDIVSKLIGLSINENKIRMKGKLINAIGHSEEIESLVIPKSDFRELKEVPRNLFKDGYIIVSCPFGAGVNLISDMDSNIYIGEVGAEDNRFTMVIVNAHLLTVDRDKVLNKALAWSPSGRPPGVKRRDTVWGEVILELLRRQDRGVLRSIHTAQPIIDDFIVKFPHENSESIRTVLDYVLSRWADETKK